MTQEVKNGRAVITVHLDPERDAEPFSDPPTVTALHGLPGSAPAVDKLDFHWTSADTLEAEITLRGGETLLSTVEASGAGRLTLSPVCLPYAPEFKPVEADEGLPALDRIARATNGKERTNLAGLWKDMPDQARMAETSPWLLTLAVLLFLLEVIERRTGLVSLGRTGLSNLRLPMIKRESIASREAAPARAPRFRFALKRKAAPNEESALSQPRKEETPSKRPEATPTLETEEVGVVDALRRARSRAGKRTKQR